MSCRKSQDWREGNGLGRSLAAAMDLAEGRLAVCFGRGGARGGERRMKGRPRCGRLPKRILRGSTPIPCSDMQQKADVFSDGRSHTLLHCQYGPLSGIFPGAWSHTLRSGGKALRPLVFSGVWSHIPFPADDVHGTLVFSGVRSHTPPVRSCCQKKPGVLRRAGPHH